MKKIFLLAGAVTLAVPVFAQNGFYLSPSIGAGISNVKQDFYTTDINGNKIEKAGIFSYNGSLNAGYKHNHWRLEAGIQYSTSGYKYDNLVFGNSFPDTTGLGSSEIRYKHLSIPIRLGYEIKLADKLALVPICRCGYFL